MPASAAAWVSARQIPAWSGAQGPGESRIPAGRSAMAACTSIASLRTTCVSAPSSPT